MPRSRTRRSRSRRSPCAAVFDGRGRKYFALVKSSAINFEPTTVPLTLMSEPLALLLNATWPIAYTASGYSTPSSTESTTNAASEVRM